jgi:hypothetical protein
MGLAQTLAALRAGKAHFDAARGYAEQAKGHLQRYLQPPEFDPALMGAAIADGFSNARRLYGGAASMLGRWGEWTLADRKAAYRHYVLDPRIALRKAIDAVKQGARPRPVDGLPEDIRRQVIRVTESWAAGFRPEEMLRLFTPASAVGGAKLGQFKAENAHLVAWDFMGMVDDCSTEAGVPSLWIGQSRGREPPPAKRLALEKLNSAFAEMVGGFENAEADDLLVRIRVEQSGAIARSPQGTAPAATPAPCLAARVLNSTEKRILSHCRRKAHTGERIAHHLGLNYDYIRKVLAKLVKDRRLRNADNGYRTM